MFLLEEVREHDTNKQWNPMFQMMHLETSQQIEHKTLKAAKAPQNRSLNRYRDVLPYDDTRVHLKTGNTDYINANYVEVSDVDRKYILAQGPLQNTSGDFWRMIWENDSTSVIMLCRIVEKQMIKCHPYWPMGEDEVVEFGSFQIQNVQTVMKQHYVIRDLQLTYVLTGETKSIKQYHFMTWPDFGVPDDANSFVEFLNTLRRDDVFQNQRPPVIHCSAGIGRSGTLILVDAALKLCEDKNSPNSLDVRKMLLALRQFRCGLVQTPQQFRFAHLAILTGLHDKFPSLFSDVPKEIEEGDEDEAEPPALPEKSKHNKVPPKKPPRASHATNTPTPEDDVRKYNQITDLESSDGSGEDEVIDLSEVSDDNEEDEDTIPDSPIDSQEQPQQSNGVVESNGDEEDYQELDLTGKDSEEDDNEVYQELDLTKVDQNNTGKTDTSESQSNMEKDDKVADLPESSTTAPTTTDKDSPLPEPPTQQKSKISTAAGSKARENELRQRERSEKKEATQELINNIKQRMKDSENKAKKGAFENNTMLLYVGVAIVVTSCVVLAYKWLS
ncbi:tyrosine-protein phosphatase non-receptor type 2-like isoform X1 [Clytia hemisphaerica]|uniref:protein-tyrosine-phosphatase n=1 Tax=Clytia hemisphaerica TaxID=252671 RepID=A0A7M5UWE4_9CNID